MSTPSSVRVQTSKLVMPSHADVRNTNLMAASQLLQWLDMTACLSAELHSKHPSVTVSMDDLEFYEKVAVGSLLLITATVTRSFNSSMEVSCKVETEDLKSGVRKKICSTAYFTFVSLDSESKKVLLPPLVPETDEEKHEFAKALERRNMRLQSKAKVQETATLSLQAENENSLLRTASSSSSSSSLSSTASSTPSFATSTSASIGSGDSSTRLMSDTAVVSTEIIFSQHANHHGTLFGGQVLDWMCSVATMSASRMRCGYCILKSIDDVHFLLAGFQGERVVLSAQVNNSFQTSLEVGVKVEAYPIGGATRKINSAYFTFVALDDQGSKMILPVIVPQTPEEQRRFHEARARRSIRLERRSARSEQIVLSVQWSPENKRQLEVENFTNLLIMRGMKWDLVSETQGVTLSIKEDGGGHMTSLKVEGTMPQTATKIFKYLSHPSKRREWDPFFESAKTLQKLDEYNSLIHIKLKKSSSFGKPRDFVVLASRRFPSDFSPSFLIALRSVILPDVPPEEGIERNETKASGFIITPISERLCKVCFINQMSSSTASHYATEIVGASKLLQESFIQIRQRVCHNPLEEEIEKEKKAEEPHFSDVDICRQS